MVTQNESVCKTIFELLCCTEYRMLLAYFQDKAMQNYEKYGVVGTLVIRCKSLEKFLNDPEHNFTSTYYIPYDDVIKTNPNFPRLNDLALFNPLNECFITVAINQFKLVVAAKIPY